MCGIVGWMGQNYDRDLGRRMCRLLSHRGPNADGEWENQRQNIWLGHRRLSVLDLSSEGSQPMMSASGRYVITYNGEVYNYKELREELIKLDFKFRGDSDTEVVVNAIEAWGIQLAVQRFVGMFGFGVFDQEEHCLWLVRDRLGIKPLYYSHREGELAFASELRSLQLLPWLDQSIDRDALSAYFRHLSVPAPATIFHGARKLQPGSMVCWDGVNLLESRYWIISQIAQSGLDDPTPRTFKESADELENLLMDSVKLRMQSDVPLGAFLSGGVDSSAIVALMQSQSRRPIHTFTIGFSETSHDESSYARAVAAHLGTEHHDEILTPSMVLDHIPTIASYYDEPFADSSNIPTLLLCQFAKKRVTVALSGDGGDEIFGGYPRYFWASRISNVQRWLGHVLARKLGRILTGIPAWYWDGPMTWIGGGRFAGSEGLSSRVTRLGAYLMCSPQCVYNDVLSAWKKPEELLGFRPREFLGPDLSDVGHFSWTEQMMVIDQGHQLPDDFLTKVDRASMAVSLEVRVPILDHRIVEWSWRLPRAYKVSPQGDAGKLILREVLSRYLPQKLINRPKMGFGMPLANWLRTELRPWAEDLLASDSLNKQGCINPLPVRRAWKEHLEGKDRLSQLWTVFMLVQWMENRHG